MKKNLLLLLVMLFAINFVNAQVTQVGDIATLRASTQDATVYELTGEAVVTFEYTNGTYAQVWIQDTTGAILIYDAASAVVTIDSYSVGDGVTGLQGTLATYNGLIEFIPTLAPAAGTTGNTVAPQVVDIATLLAGVSDYESELVTVQNASFDAADGTAVFATSKALNYVVTDASGSFNFRTSYADADYIGTVIPTGNLNITGLVGNYNGTAQITSRNAADIETVVVTYNVTFNVDMRPAILDTTFIYGTDSVNVTGTMFNWAEPGTVAEQELFDADGDSIFSTTIAVEAGSHQYKFFKNSTWTYGEWNGDPNRTFELVDADRTLNNIWAAFASKVDNIDKAVSIYPNPSNGQFKVSVDGTYNLQVIDLTGKIIQNRVIKNTETVNINNAGMYFLRLSNGNNISVKRVIVK